MEQLTGFRSVTQLRVALLTIAFSGFGIINSALYAQTSQQRSGTTTRPRTDPGNVMSSPPQSCGEVVLPSIMVPTDKSRSGTTTRPRESAPTLSSNAITALAKVAAQIKNIPDCRIKVTGHAAANKIDQQASWDKVNAVIRYLVEKQGIAPNRFIFEYGVPGDVDAVDLQATTEEGPSTAPAPHPDLRRM